MATIYSQVKLATEVNITLATAISPGVTTIDGVIVYANDRILVKAQTNTAQNGIYTVNSSGVWARAADFASASTQESGGLVFVTQGTIFADTGWVIATDGVITVGTTGITFTKVTVNLNLVGADIPSSVVLRAEKGYPLTIQELDNNFKYLAVGLSDKLNVVDFTNVAIRDRLNTLTAAQANLNAWKLDGALPSTVSVANTIVKRDNANNIFANRLFGDVSGTASNAVVAAYAVMAANVDGIVAVTNGGTGAINANSARTNLGAVGKDGDTMTGKLTLPAANADRASLNIPARTVVPTSPINGDIWADANVLYYRLNSVTQTVAKLDSPDFTGAPSAPTASVDSNSNAIATTAFVKNVKTNLIDTAIALKANIASPTFTGVARAPTIETVDNSNALATTAYVNNKLAAVLPSYYTSAQTNAKIATELTPYYTKTQTDSAISANNNSYYNKTSVDNKISALAGIYAPINSPNFLGSPMAPTPTVDSNSRALATTEYVTNKLNAALSNYAGISQTDSKISVALSDYYTKTQTDGAIASNNGNYYTKTIVDNKISALSSIYAPIASPVFTGAPTAPTPTIDSNNSALATTAYVTSKLNAALGNYSGISQTDSKISVALSDYYTKTQTNSAISSSISGLASNTSVDTKLGNYYTKTQTDTVINSSISSLASNTSVDTKLGNYYTKTQTDTAISNSVSGLASNTSVDTKLGNYYTKTQTDTVVNNAVASRATTTYVDGLQDKWGSSRKFVQTATPTGAVDGDIWFKV